MRDHNKLKAFQLADRLIVAVYRGTGGFPRHELFGLAQQLRRAAVSCASNIVEGCARNSEGDYLRFLDMAYGSGCEVQYQLSLAERLGYLRDEDTQSLRTCMKTWRGRLPARREGILPSPWGRIPAAETAAALAGKMPAPLWERFPYTF